MKIALVQMEIKERNCAGNTEHGLKLLEKAAEQSDLVILPEIWNTGYSLGHLKEEAVNLDSPLIKTLCGIARKYQCSLLPGSLPIRKNSRIYNMIPAISKVGKIVYEYGKAHLFGMFEEEKFFAPGESFNVFDLDGLCCGATICDSRSSTGTWPCRARSSSSVRQNGRHVVETALTYCPGPVLLKIMCSWRR